MDEKFIFRILQPEFAMKIASIRMEPQNKVGSQRTSQMFTTHSSLFHYTTLSGLMGIIDNKTLWLTNTLYLNDISEQTYAIFIIKDTISSLISSGRYSDEFNKLITPKSIPFKDVEALYSEPAYVTCFTTNGDSLYMWQGYSTSCGVSIEFDLTSDFHFAFGPNCFFRDIVYDENILKNKIQRILDEYHKEYNLDTLDVDNKNDLYSREALASILHMCSDFKNPSFHLENETRLHYRPKKDDQINFRLKGNFIISYIALPLQKINNNKKFPIKSITVGPCKEQSLVRKSVSDFVRSRGYEIEVIPSEIPYSERR